VLQSGVIKKAVVIGKGQVELLRQWYFIGPY
jgi:hypothetical protein